MGNILIMWQGNYREISEDAEVIRREIINVSQHYGADLLENLATGETVQESSVENYAGTSRINLKADVQGDNPHMFAGFLRQIEDYRIKHYADYAVIQDLTLPHGGLSLKVMSAGVQLLKKRKG